MSDIYITLVRQYKCKNAANYKELLELQINFKIQINTA